MSRSSTAAVARSAYGPLVYGYGPMDSCLGSPAAAALVMEAVRWPATEAPSGLVAPRPASLQVVWRPAELSTDP